MQQLETIAQPGGEIHAGADRMVHAEADQAFAAAERDEALCGRARDVQCLRDVVLRAPGDAVIEGGRAVRGEK